MLFPMMNANKNSDEKIEMERDERLNISAVSVCRPFNRIKNNPYRLLVAEVRFEREATVFRKAGFRMIPSQDAHICACNHKHAAVVHSYNIEELLNVRVEYLGQQSQETALQSHKDRGL